MIKKQSQDAFVHHVALAQKTQRAHKGKIILQIDINDVELEGQHHGEFLYMIDANFCYDTNDNGGFQLLIFHQGFDAPKRVNEDYKSSPYYLQSEEQLNFIAFLTETLC